jgi:DNA repair exonuclease SbcCD ATPase subunit
MSDDEDVNIKLLVAITEKDAAIKQSAWLALQAESLNQQLEDYQRMQSEYKSLLSDNNDLVTRNNELMNATDRVNDLEVEVSDLKAELTHVQFDLDILQVDYHQQLERHTETETQLKLFRRKTRNLQVDLDEADRATTKRLSRMVVRVDTLEKEKIVLTNQLTMYEESLSSLGLLCFVCRSGIKTAQCDTCVEKVCKECHENMNTCPFCRCERRNFVDMQTI